MYIYRKTSNHLLLLVLVVLVIYYPTLFSPLNSLDDTGMYQYLLNTDNFRLLDILLPGASGSYYRPIILLSFMMDKYVWGLEESFMHLENILIHLANVLLVYSIARRANNYLLKPTQVSSFVAALFFAIHPLNTEAVNWISGRTDLIAGFFLLLSMYMILKRPLNWFHSLIAAICMLLACFTKETAIFFLPAALLFPFFMSADRTLTVPLRSIFRNYWYHFIIFCNTGFAYFAFRKLAFSKGDQGVTRVIAHVGGSESFGILINSKLVLKATGFYAKKLLIPFPLNFGIVHVSDAYLPVGLFIFGWIIWLLYQRTLPAFFVICAGAVGTSALMIPLLFLTWTPLAERYMYVPSAFFLISVALASPQYLEQYLKYRVPLNLVVLCLVAIALYGTSTRNILWQDNLALYQDTLRKSPGFIPAQNEIARILYERGKNQEATAILKSLEIPEDLINRQYGVLSKAAALANSNDFEGARTLSNQILKNPGKHEVLILQWFLEMDKFQLMANKAQLTDLYSGSVKTLTRLIELTGDPFYSYRLGVVNMQVGEKDKALAAFTTVVRTAPPTAYYLKPAEKLAKGLAK